MADVVYKDEQIQEISNKLNVSKKMVIDVWETYVGLNQLAVDMGKSIKFLNIFYVCVEGDRHPVYNTLAYDAREIGDSLNTCSEMVYRILTELEEYILKNLASNRGVCVRGIVTLSVEGSERKVVRARRSYVLGHGSKIYQISSFRRKMEVLLNARKHP